MNAEARRLVEAMLASDAAWKRGASLVIHFPSREALDEAAVALTAVAGSRLTRDEEAMLREPSPL